ncbi:unnamed protein product [Phaedon cochleariae]|uniref:Myb-like, SWIRM and MPN domain-containing protein 1 n=1 Tax=Phaedon cochleariae TaxID=80249 RepID=A0A9P0DVZ0_PHACE|nr:unnamed protein product [Phaedon cochleariae]
MADEDEIDILGDFSLDIFSSRNETNTYDNSLVSENSDLLKCDYTIHPQWLLDRPSANPDNWYNTNIPSLSQSENDALGLICTQNSITDESGWTEKEKSLLERGIEIFGKSNDRLSQFIGSKTASEVKYYLKNFYSEHQTNANLNESILEHTINTSLVTDVLNENQIPASVEEVIATVSTAKPTIQTFNHKRQRRSSLRGCFNTNDLKKSVSFSKFHHDRSNAPSKQHKKNLMMERKTTNLKPSKFRERVKMKMSSCVSTSGIKQKIVKISNESSKQSEIKKAVITTGQGLSVPICEGEEIVKLKSASEESDTDIDIDVELSDEDIKTSKINKKIQTCIEKPVVTEQQKTENIPVESELKNECFIPSTEIPDLTKLSEPLQKELTSLKEPTSELELNSQCITELEKVIHSEYFDASPIKTPERYLKIRNHILSGWKDQKPNYLFKTSSRQGLKNCGDVNSFGRIHNFLEQIGAINFGCEQVIYYRPLIDMVHEYSSTIREKKNIDMKIPDVSSNKLGGRDRFKKKFVNDGEGGYTLSHGENGQIIKNTVINEEPSSKQKVYIRKPTVRLIYCRPFNEEFQQPYTLKMHLSTLLIMDFHSHTSLTEVMGLVAGRWTARKNMLTITGYEPCRNAASSATHCDMCPISQARAADVIHRKGLDIVGWFHSHPTFAPEPSQQDLDTQRSVQQWLGQHKPCVAVILSPFSSNGALIASPMRCFMVDRKVRFEDQFVPYKFKVDIELGNFDLEDFLSDFHKVLKWILMTNKDDMMKLGQPYFQDSSITFLEKYITSVRMNLAKCGNLNKASCNKIIQGITDIYSRTNNEQTSP